MLYCLCGTDLHTGAALRALIDVHRNSFALLQLINLCRTDVNALATSITLFAVNYDLNHCKSPLTHQNVSVYKPFPKRCPKTTHETNKTFITLKNPKTTKQEQKKRLSPVV